MTTDPQTTYRASTPLHAHACNCIGCCPKCGTCRTWSGHTAEWCRLVAAQADERAAFIAHVRGGGSTP